MRVRVWVRVGGVRVCGWVRVRGERDGKEKTLTLKIGQSKSSGSSTFFAYRKLEKFSFFNKKVSVFCSIFLCYLITIHLIS